MHTRENVNSPCRVVPRTIIDTVPENLMHYIVNKLLHVAMNL